MLPAHLSLLLLSCLVLVQDSSAFIEAQVTPSAEYYTLDDKQYSIHLQPVSWYEAQTICVAGKATLMEISSPAVAEYIGEALAESQAHALGLWIGARGEIGVTGTSGQVAPQPHRTPGEELSWTWQGSKGVIPKPSAATEFPMNITPYWGSQPPVRDDGVSEYCIVMARKMHHLPLISADLCLTLRPFICEKSNFDVGSNEVVQVKPSVVVEEKEYFLFHAAFTWSQALVHCRSFGMRLASVVNMKQAEALKHRMQRSRPIMENAWIGGLFMGNRWLWVTTNEEINTTDAAANNPTTNLAEVLVPWYRPKQIIQEGCLLADRHVCDHFTYVEANCDRQRSFICEIEKSSPSAVIIPVPRIDNIYISTGKRPWGIAQGICRYCVEGHLYQPKAENHNVLHELYHSMVHILPDQVRHLWVGGYLYWKDKESRFKWVEIVPKSNEDLKDITSLVDETYNFERKENGSLTLCPLEIDQYPFLRNYPCLNLDRENDKDFLMYGLICEYKQHFLCLGTKPVNKMCTNHYWNEGIIDTSDFSRF